MIADAANRLLLGESRPMVELRERIRKAARCRLPVLITGATGSGKELVAQAIHELSGVRGHYVALNVSAIAETIFEATLFGHLRGAFTGANTDLPGYLSEANGGTLFLDEIGSLPSAQQAKLLRAIEAKTYRPLGGSSDRRSDFRLLTATCEDIGSLVAAGRLRRDLFYRIGAIHIRVPALAEHREDVELLAAHFARLAAAKGGLRTRFSESALQALSDHEWPGNVRELKSLVECLVSMHESELVGREIVVDGLHRSRLLELDVPTIGSRIQAGGAQLAELMRIHENDTGAVAAALGVNRTTVYRRLADLGMATPKRGHSRSIEPPAADARG